MGNNSLKKIVFDGIRDFDTVHIFECGQCFRWLPCDEDGSYFGVAGPNAARVSFDDGRLTVEASGGDEGFWYDYFDLGTDYGAIKEELIKGEPRIKPACDYGCGIRILKQDLFETIISFIISQNNNIPRIRKNIEALCEAYGEEIGEFGGRMIYSFPTPETLAKADACDLAELRLGYRCEYIKASSQRFLDEGAPKDRSELLEMHGVGPKVANCIMLFGLEDVAAFPIDTWVRHIMNDMYGLNENDIAGMQGFASDRFGALAGYAQQYLFYYYRDRKA